MKKILLLTAIFSFCLVSFKPSIDTNNIQAKENSRRDSLTIPESKVDIDAYEKLLAEAKEHRKTRLIDINKFMEKAKEKNVVILDARSGEMYSSKHIKGAINLNFSDFTQENLAKVIPSFDTEILIYCNNNFKNDEKFFPTKISMPSIQKKGGGEKEITLALNIPTYVNLYGYGYMNVYELSGFIDVNDSRLEFEGSSVK